MNVKKNNNFMKLCEEKYFLYSKEILSECPVETIKKINTF